MDGTYIGDDSDDDGDVHVRLGPAQYNNRCCIKSEQS